MIKFLIYEVVFYILVVLNYNILFEGYFLCLGVKKINLMGEMFSGKIIV